MADTALSLRERAEFLLRVAARATPRATANLESLAREYLQRAKELEQGSRPNAFRPIQTDGWVFSPEELESIQKAFKAALGSLGLIERGRQMIECAPIC